MAPHRGNPLETVSADRNIGDSVAGRLFDIFTSCHDDGRRLGRGGGRMTTMIYPGASAGQTVMYEYDKADRRTKMTIPGGTVFTYDYDSAGRLSLVINPQGERSTFAYDKDDRRKEVHRANNTKTTYLYDKASRLTTLTHVNSAGTELAKFTYSYDKVGNRKQCNELGGDIVTWTYDEIYQLQREKRNGASAYDITHTYDEVGNRLTMNSSGTITTYAACDAANQLTTSQTGAAVTTYTYDANGNLEVENAGGTRTTHTWDDENRLAQVAKTGMTTNVYTFNGYGKRVKIVDSTGTRKLLWDEENILLESNTSDAAQVIYTLEPAGYGNLISQRRSSTTSFYLFDALGSTRKLTSSAAAVTDSYDFKAYGETNGTSGTTVNVFKWVGELGYYLDVDRAAYYLRARPYSPKLARFLSVDPLGFGGRDPNFYLYVWNAPISWIDPSGYGPCGIPDHIILSQDGFRNYIMTLTPAEAKRIRDCLKRTDSRLWKFWVWGEKHADMRNIRKQRGGFGATKVIGTIGLCGRELAVAQRYNACIQNAQTALESCLSGITTRDRQTSDDMIANCVYIFDLDAAECSIRYAAEALGCLLPFSIFE